MTAFRLPFGVKLALIEEVKNHPILWKGEHEKYGERYHTAAAWKTIAQKLNISDNILRAKWKNLRNIFRGILKKTGISELEEYDGTWKYFHFMAFVKDEFKEEETVEFIVETYSDEETSDKEFQDKQSTGTSKHYDDDNDTTDDQLIKINYDDRAKNKTNDNKSTNDAEIIRHIDKREYDDRTYYEKLDEDEIPPKRPKLLSDRKANYDVMFLRSLAPYFKQLEPLRKLVIRSKIQDLLLNEIAEQNSLKHDG